jgi:hypothetical protein
VTALAREAVLLEIPVNLDRLFSDKDPHYELWIQSLVEEVAAKRKKIADRIRTK